MAVLSSLRATPIPAPNVVPISDGSGTLNDWVDLPEPCVPITIGSAAEYTVEENCQQIYAYPIRIEGLAIIDGLLVGL